MWTVYYIGKVVTVNEGNFTASIRFLRKKELTKSIQGTIAFQEPTTKDLSEIDISQIMEKVSPVNIRRGIFHFNKDRFEGLTIR